MQIKVCGLTNPENIEGIYKLGVDYLGFIFYPKSPRWVEALLTNTDFLPHDAQKVGVFVNEKYEKIKDCIEKYQLTHLQFHGDEDSKFIKQFKNMNLRIFNVFKIDENFDFSIIKDFESSADYFLFDTQTKNHGGSGKKFNWESLQNYTGKTPFLLSGGIKPEDYKLINEFKHPQFAGVDLNSGFELKPGLKDINKLKFFLEKLRN